MLAHEKQDGDVVGVTTGDGGEAVGSARSGSGHGNANLTGGPGVAISNFHAEAFVASCEGSDGRGITQRFPKRSQTSAGEPGYVTYSLFFQCLNNGVGSTHNGSFPIRAERLAPLCHI